MTKKDILRVTQIYRKRLSLEFLESCSIHGTNLSHCNNILDNIDIFADKDIEKAFRWIGFVQGVLWAHKIYSIDELREHNKNSLNFI